LLSRKLLGNSPLPESKTILGVYNPFSSDVRFFLTLLGIPFLLFSFNPYLSFYPLPTDQQPTVHLFSVPLFFFFLAARLDKISIVLLFPSVFALGLLFADPSFETARSAYNYLSFLVIFFVTLGVLKYTNINFKFILVFTFFVWFFVGLIQQIFPDFLLFLVNNARTTNGRGVTGLATEPTFYGIVMLFYILLFRITRPKFETVYIILASVAIFAFAKSAMAALFVILYFFVVSFFGKYWSVRFFYLGLIPFVPVFFRFLPEGRMKSVLSSLLENPVDVVFSDASVNDRFFHVFLSLKGVFSNFGVPHGFSSFVTYAEDQLSVYSGFIIVEWFTLSGRIMSGLGAALFELGIFGAIYIFVSLFIMYPLCKWGVGFFLSTTFLFFIIFVSAVPLGFSFFPLFLSVVYYKTRYPNAL